MDKKLKSVLKTTLFSVEVVSVGRRLRGLKTKSKEGQKKLFKEKLFPGSWKNLGCAKLENR